MRVRAIVLTLSGLLLCVAPDLLALRDFGFLFHFFGPLFFAAGLLRWIQSNPPHMLE